jgi:hypothetical protein
MVATITFILHLELAVTFSLLNHTYVFNQPSLEEQSNCTE